MPAKVAVQIVCALPDRQRVIDLHVEPGTTIAEVLERPGVREGLPGVDLAGAAVGSYGRVRARDERLEDGDRIEIYRPLLNDPKDLRRRRAGKR